MSIIKQKDKRTGTTYVYESKSYWDKEKQQPRSNRTLIGKLDEETGEIVPTAGRGKKSAEKNKPVSGNTALYDDQKQQLKEKDILINQLTVRNKELEKELASMIMEIRNILGKYEERRLPRP
jgi:hypothetical protein